MRIAITGGAGFLGARLAAEILERGELGVAGSAPAEVDVVRLLDRVAPPDTLPADGRIDAVVGSLDEQLVGGPLGDADVIVHLAAAVSGECERDFDLGMDNNLDVSRRVFEAARRQPRSPVVVFASSVAVFGAVPGYPMPDEIADDTLPIPRSSYGTQKFMCEQLLSDHTRRGHLRGRTARLMTVTVRPGRPNAAASSFVSGIIREPLNGERSVCPVPESTPLAVSSPRRTIDGLLCAITASDDAWGSSLAVNFPSLTVTPREMVEAMDRVAGAPVSDLVDWSVDPAIVDVVASWPARFRADRAAALGLVAEPDFDAIVAAYMSR